MPASCCAKDALAAELIFQEIRMQLKEGLLKKAILHKLNGHKQPRCAPSGLNRKKKGISSPVLLRESTRGETANPRRFKRGTAAVRTRK